MAKMNENYLNLKESYLFSEVAARVKAYKDKNPDKKVIPMGIGDVTLPLVTSVVEAMKVAASEMGQLTTFRGYGPEQGYEFLRLAISEYYSRLKIRLDTSEIFISDGAKSDVGNITDLFSNDNVIMIPDPVYPVYVDSNLMLGRHIEYLDANEGNNFLPLPDNRHADIIYLCSPNNPTGAVYSKKQLALWVDYALEHDSIILFDAAYESFIIDNELPRSIFEIPGAEKCAIEFCSLSKTAGFTGTRCGYTIVPKALTRKSSNGADISINKLWNRRQTTKFNGVSYIIQRGAAAVFSEEGQIQVKKPLDYYRGNARIMGETLTKCGVYYSGGTNSPYLWLRCPNNMASWDFFDFLLENANVVGTPGAGFGKNGEGFFRLTAFSTRENTIEAMDRFMKLFG
ncbi:MAG: LL-diaminopimelate aminotransferase [Clostridiales bacterium]|nr:LL-diaminopimelate aminotransferase [Clostridiales bacterium]